MAYMALAPGVAFPLTHALLSVHVAQPGELKKEINDLVWFPASVSREVLLKNRGREGLKMAKPLWTEIMELMGGTFKDIQEGFYRGEF